MRTRASDQFKISPSIVYLESSFETVEDSGIPFEVRMLTSLAKKPTLKDNTNKDAKPFDPFMPPFEPGLFVSDLSTTHRLLFNKFMICKQHSLVVSKEFERQDVKLKREDALNVKYIL